MDSDALDETQPTLESADTDATQATAAAPADSDSQPMAAAEASLPSQDDLDAPEPQELERRADQPDRPDRSWVLWAVLGIMVLLLIAAGSAYTGYRSAIQERVSFQATQVSGDTQAQFELALEDIQAGRFDLARQRLEYVVQLDPSYPGVAEKLAQVLQELRTTATPTFAPTPTLTPTPDLRGRDELFVQAQSLLLSENWSDAIETLLVLRKKYPDFMAIKVDGMLFVALRNRGIDKIANEADLEGGTYDLSLAERFGPLDVEAKNWRDWAELYILGASFWDVNWEQAVFYFSQLAPVTPNLRDGSGWTAVDRYLLALIGFGDWLTRQGDWCRAQEQYRLYLDMRQNPELEPTAVFAEDQCASGAGVPAEGELPVVSETPTPGGVPIDLTPSPSPTQETPPPENTPYPSP